MNYCGTRHPIKFKLQPQGSELKLSDVERRIFGARFTGAADEAWPPNHNQCNQSREGVTGLNWRARSFQKGAG
jgi:hypothetical protein